MSARPVWVHLTSFAFGAASHPGVFRCVQGLVPHAENVVLHWGAPRYADEPADEASQPGVRAYPLAGSKLLKKPFAVAHLLAGVRRRHGRPAAVIAHFGNNGWRGLPLAAAADVPVLTLFHGEDAARRVANEQYAESYRRLFAAPAARFRTVARHLADSLRDAGAPSDAVAVHHLGVPLPAPSPREASPGARLSVALVGRLLPVKGHAVAFDAVARAIAAGADLTLHCYGDGPGVDDLRGRLAAAKLTDRVHLHGALSSGALEQALRGMDAVIQPSVTDPDGRAEGLPNALLEAMALSLPAVGSDHGGIPEAIVDGETGLLVPEGDAEALAQALLRLAADPDERRRMGAAGRERVEAEFSLEGQGARLADDVKSMADAYLALAPSSRRAAWARCIDGFAEPRAATGRREQVRWLGRIATNRLRGAIP